MIYAQLFHKSTGWNGTDFSGPVKSIPMCGSDGVVMLDARKNVANQIGDVNQRISKHINKDSITGFRIYATASLRDTGTPRCKYQKLQEFEVSED